MNIDDFLKVKQVRCIDGVAKITTGKVYDVIGLDETCVHVTDDDGEEACYWYCRFEPVLEPVVNPLQGVELTPEFEAVEPVLADNSEVNIQDNSVNTQDNSVNIQDTPKFKVGDKVYLFGTDYIEEITKIIGANVYLAGADFDASVSIKEICHATQENYERLQDTFTDIEFEKPPKELKGSDLCRAMLDSGWKYVPCYVHDGSDDEAINRKHYVSVKNETPRSGYNFSGTGANDWKYAVPIDPRTGEPLTESVLND